MLMRRLFNLISGNISQNASQISSSKEVTWRIICFQGTETFPSQFPSPDDTDDGFRYGGPGNLYDWNSSNSLSPLPTTIAKNSSRNDDDEDSVLKGTSGQLSRRNGHHVPSPPLTRYPWMRSSSGKCKNFY